MRVRHAGKRLQRHARAGRRLETGFTLLETLVAMAILGLGVTSILQLMGTSTRGAARAQAVTEAIFVAEELMEELNTLDEQELRSRGREAGDYAEHERRSAGRSSSLLQVVRGAELGNRYSYAVHINPDRNQPGLFRMDVDVTWANGGGGQVTLTTLRRFAAEEMAGGEGVPGAGSMDVPAGRNARGGGIQPDGETPWTRSPDVGDEIHP